MATKMTPREKLEARRERILAQLEKERGRKSVVLDGLGFGYAMRGYSRLKNLSFTKETELQDRLTEAEASLTLLGWRDPRKPVEPVRTEEEQLRHYCDVMGLDFEEQINKQKALKTPQEGTFVVID